MGNPLNDIILTGTMLENLYAHSLVEITGGSPDSKQRLSYLGSNAKRVTILVSCSDYVFLPEDQLSFLTRMLGACKMNIGDVAVVNMALQASAGDIMLQLGSEKIIAFGCAPPGKAGTLFAIESTDGIPWLYAPSLQDLLDSADALALKNSLWQALRKMFAIP